MILAKDTIEAMAEALQRVRRVPQREWFEPIIERLRSLEPGQKFTIERLEQTKQTGAP